MLNNVPQKIGKSLSWLFNNNGHKVDTTRIRLVDGSPVHSTGLSRLRYNWECTAAISMPIIYNAAYSLPMEDLTISMLFSTTYLSYMRFLLHAELHNKFGKNCGQLCINTEPDNNTPPTCLVPQCDGMD